MRKEKGFSLIELLIVVAIILIIAAIAVPNLLRSRMAANESSAAASLRTIGTANVTFSSTYNAGYAGELTEMARDAGGAAASITAADLLDAVLGGSTAPVKSGYSFQYSASPVGAGPTSTTPNTNFTAGATPVGPNSSGTSTFCADQSNVVGRDVSGAATAGGTAGNNCDFMAYPPM